MLKVGMVSSFSEFKIGRAHVELQSHDNLVCRLLLEKKEMNMLVGVEIVHADHVVLYAGPSCSAPRLFFQVGEGRVHVAEHGVFFNDTATTEIYTLSLHDALPI